MSFEMMGEFEKAYFHVQKALENSLPPSLHSTAITLSRRLKVLVEKDKITCRNEPRPESLVTGYQTLRLNFLKPPPKNYYFGNIMNIRMCLTNEFGLWDRQNFRQVLTKDTEQPVFKSTLSLQCNVIVLYCGSNNSSSTTIEYANLLKINIRNSPIFGLDGKVHILLNLYLYDLLL